MILKTIKVEPVIKNPGLDNKNSTVNRIGSDSKVGGAKLQVKSQTKLSKSKNGVRSSLGKSQLLIEANSKPHFLTPKARLAFARLRQAFIKATILHHFLPKWYIRVETNALGYAIGEILSQLTLDNLD